MLPSGRVGTQLMFRGVSGSQWLCSVFRLFIRGLTVPVFSGGNPLSILPAVSQAIHLAAAIEVLGGDSQAGG